MPSAERAGFADLQVNGFLGVDFSAPGLTVEAVARVTDALRNRGTAAYCPTMITADEEIYRQNLPVLARAMEDPHLSASLLGIHLEGPFISSRDGARGAHPASATRLPDLEYYERLRAWAGDRVALVTLAPELPGSEHLIRHIRATGAHVSIGHHMASFSEIRSACDAGAEAVTHFGNGIPNLLARHPNPLWDQLAEDRLQLMLITDGHHVPETLIRSVLLARGVNKTLVVSDAAPIAAMPAGRYSTLGQEVILEPSGRLWNPVGNHLVGSSATMIDCMNVLAGLGILEEEGLWAVGLQNPLRLIGKDSASITSGHDAPSVRFVRNHFEVCPHSEPGADHSGGETGR
jgi:N-acetylglucosamine-6-phosphate deacetylase